jgi:hypothetical protein
MAQIGDGPPAAGDHEIGKGRGDESGLSRVDRSEGRELGEEAARGEADEEGREAERFRYAEALDLVAGATVGENPDGPRAGKGIIRSDVAARSSPASGRRACEQGELAAQTKATFKIS